MTAEETLRGIFVEVLDVDEKEVIPTAEVRYDLGADPLDEGALLVDMEDKFDIKIPDEDAERLVTFGDCVKYIEQRLAEKAGAR